MTPSRLLTFCFIIVSVSCYSQSDYTRVISGFTAMAGGKTEWIDLDNDNDLDLLFVGSDGSATLTVVYENVAGTLTQRSTNLPSMSGFVSADYDNDGDVDILAFNLGMPFTKLYRNDGGFTFSERISFGAFSPTNASWLDIDNDEDLDFLLVGGISIPRLFENTGSGFTEIVNTNFPNCLNCNSDIADINGDGKVDIVFAGDMTSLYLNTGNKQFSPDTTTSFQQPTLSDVACGDFDSDGDFDILSAGLLNGAPYTAIYENKNNHPVERTDLGLTPVITNSSSGLLWYNVNNDGKIDLFLSGSTNLANPIDAEARVFKNNGGSFTDIHDAYLSIDHVTGSYDAGDFDNDGDMDLGFQGTYGVLEGTFSPKPVVHRMAGYYRHYQIQKAFMPNTKPTPPSVTTFSENTYRKEIRLKWGDGSDGETPATGLFYNFYLRDANKKLIVPNVNFSNGNVLTTNAPNATGRAGYAFDMAEGNLYYAVQSIDGAKMGSVFSSEKMLYHFNGPEAVSATFTDQQHVDLLWLDHSSQEANFEILRSTSPTAGFTSLATLPADTKSYTDNFSFATETKYYYRVRDYNSQASAYDSLMLVIPNRPTNLVAQSINASKIILTWEDQSQFETAYVIERKQGTSSFTVVAILSANMYQYDDTQLLSGTTYEYRVISKGLNGALGPINSVTATTNAKPSGVNFEVSQDEDKSLMLTSNDFNSHFTDANALDKLVKFTIISLPDNGTLYVYASPAVVGQEVTPDLFDFIVLKPLANYAGTTTLKLRPYDGKDYSDNDWIISLKINQVNDPPVFDLLSTKVLDEDFANNIKIVPQPYYFSGEESQVITYSISPQISDIVNMVSNMATGEISLSSLKDKFGEVEFTVTANDGQALNNTYSKKIKVTITAVDDPPVFAPIADIVAESSSYITVGLDVTDPDNGINALMFSAYSYNNTIVKNEKIKFSDSKDGKVKMTINHEERIGKTNILVNVHDVNFYVSQQFNFSVTVITGIEKDPQSDITLFPNPVLKDLQIQIGGGENEILTFVLRNALGQTLQSGTITKSTDSIDFSNFTSGLYFLEIAGSHQTTFRKIIRQ